MNENLKEFFFDILDTPSPSGHEAKLGKKFAAFMKPFVDEVFADSMGNVVAHKKGDPSKSLIVEAHSDEIGLMVTYVDNNGYLFFKPIGGVDPNILPGTQISVHCIDGEVRLGVIGRKPIHLLTAKEREVVVKLEDLWVDMGFKTKEEANQFVRVGTPMTFNVKPVILPNGYVTSKSLDDKAGIAVVAGVAQKICEDKIDTDLDIYFVASTQEEIGTRGAQVVSQRIQPKMDISLDVTHAIDYPGVTAAKFGDISMGEGVVIPYGPNLNQKLNDLYIKIAGEKNIPYQLEAIPRATSTNARTIQLAGEGVVTSLLSIPCRYMHTQTEMISLDDVDSAANLISSFCACNIDPEDFFPLTSVDLD